jgi:uncharacterized protein
MTNLPNHRTDAQKVVAIVAAAGGELVGRTRLQKLAYLLELTGVGDGFRFHYKHYGPYCEELTEATRDARLLGLLEEEERLSTWGGSCSVFKTTARSQDELDPARVELARIATGANAIELELAATAAFLFEDGVADPWAETATRKPAKAKDGRLANAQKLYAELSQVHTPRPLPMLGG